MRISLAQVRRTARARAPGKVILLGEHAVVYGALAIAGSIDRQVVVEVRAGNRSTPLGAADPLRMMLDRAGAMFGVDTAGLVASAAGDLPQAVGLGSSAALSVALVRAVAALAHCRVSTATVCAAAFELEKLFHGSPSGVDHSTAAYGGLITFRRGDVRALRTEPLAVVIALGQAARATRTAIAAVRARRDRDPAGVDAIFSAIDALAHEAAQTLAAGQHALIGRLMHRNHELLRALGVSTPELDAMVDLAHRYGALGAKLTGGGGGGAVVCIPGGDGASLVDAFRRAGWRAFATRVGDSRRDSHAAVDRSTLVSAAAQR